MDHLIHRGVYRIGSRNLVVGAWDANRQGFIGVREKFSSRYLFTEYHWDTGPPTGTAREIEFLFVLPDDIPLREYNPMYCKICGSTEIEWVPDGDGSPTGKRHHIDRPVDDDHPALGILPMNMKLLHILDPYGRDIKGLTDSE